MLDRKPRRLFGGDGESSSRRACASCQPGTISLCFWQHFCLRQVERLASHFEGYSASLFRQAFPCLSLSSLAGDSGMKVCSSGTRQPLEYRILCALSLCPLPYLGHSYHGFGACHPATVVTLRSAPWFAVWCQMLTTSMLRRAKPQKPRNRWAAAARSGRERKMVARQRPCGLRRLVCHIRLVVWLPNGACVQLGSMRLASRTHPTQCKPCSASVRSRGTGTFWRCLT